MKKYNFKINEKKIRITLSAILTGTILITTMSSCSKTNIDDKSSISDTSRIYDSSEAKNNVEETSSSATSEIISYNFSWEYDETEAFEKIVKKEFNMSIARYICYYGFTEDLNKKFTSFINNRFSTEYSYVPFKKANYFFDYIKRDDDLRHDYDNYDNFKRICLRDDDSSLSAFNNKLILSYLIHNNIPLGERIPIDNFKSILGEELYKYDGGWKLIIKNPKTGNYNRSYVYNRDELFQLLQVYNNTIYRLCSDNSIKTCNLFEKPEVIDHYNSHLKKFYHIDIKLGEVPTKEQYRAMFGEDPLDLSYIPGALIK